MAATTGKEATMKLVWGVATRPKEGQSISGDTYVLEQHEHYALAAVIDGLGGGAEAAHAAELAAGVLRGYPDQPLPILMQQSHTALHGTRGAVIGMLRLNFAANTLAFMGVGNIGIYAASQQSIKPISKNGILGYRLPTLLQLDYSYNSGDTFVLYSDGITSQFLAERELQFAGEPQHLADTILARYGKLNDDATVLVVRPHH